jgi:biotin carboxyl carrier protein
VGEREEAGKISMDTVEELLNDKHIIFAQSWLHCWLQQDPDITSIEAPLNANVWKVEIKEGAKIEKEKVVTILETMKLEISARSEDKMTGWVVEKVLVRPNDVVQAGNPLVLLRKLKWTIRVLDPTYFHLRSRELLIRLRQHWSMKTNKAWFSALDVQVSNQRMLDESTWVARDQGSPFWKLLNVSSGCRAR